MSQDFYDRYWQIAGGAPPETGYAMAERKALLKSAFSGLTEGAAVLDAGCGHGEFSYYLDSLGFEVSGIDVSSVAVERARALLPASKFYAASLEDKLPFAESAFSGVWFTEVIEHLFDVYKALSELNRILEMNGLLVLTTPYHGMVKNVVLAMHGYEKHYDPYLSHIRFFTKKSLEICLNDAGFQVLDWKGIGRFWPLWMGQLVVAEKVSSPGFTSCY